MWFKQLRLYQLSHPIGYDVEQLAAQLASKPAAPCPKVSAYSVGWTNPITNAPMVDDDYLDPQTLVHAANGYILICLSLDERLLPSSVVKQSLQEKIDEIEMQQARKVGRREKQSIQDELYFSLLPKAFTKQSRVYAYIDTQHQHMIVDVANKKLAEYFLNCWHESVAEVKLVQQPLTPPASTLTRWVQENALPASLSTSDNVVLRRTSCEKTVVRCQNQDVFAEEINRFLQRDYQVVQLGLQWAEKVSFTLKEDGIISGVRFLDLVQSLASEAMAETPEQRFDADFVIMTETLTQLIHVLLPYTDNVEKPNTPTVRATADLAI